MTTQTNGPFFLTSSVVQPVDDGNYPYHVTTLLVPHEAIRREFIRAERAIQNMDVLSHPFHIDCFSTWVTEFFVKAIHHHHDFEELIYFPFYKDLGAIFPEKQTDDHKTLISLLEELDRISNELNELVKSGTAESTTIVEKQKYLKDHFEKINSHMLAHLAEEEQYWPSIVEQFGKEKCDQVEQLIVDTGISSKGPEGEAFKLLGSSVWFSMGFESSESKKYPALMPFKPWCSSEWYSNFSQKVPWFVRKFVFSSWDVNYQRYRAMIESVSGNQAVLQNTNPPQSCCVIS